MIRFFYLFFTLLLFFPSYIWGTENKNNIPCSSPITRTPQAIDTGYKEAMTYFQQRNRPRHHFFNVGVALNPLTSLYPLQFRSEVQELLSFHAHYRLVKRGAKKTSTLFAMGYRPGWQDDSQWFSLMIGRRYPTSSDRTRFHWDILLGTSFLLDKVHFSTLPVNIQLLFTHILGRGIWIRPYVQWGFTLEVTKLFLSPSTPEWTASFTVRAGWDFHL